MDLAPAVSVALNNAPTVDVPPPVPLNVLSSATVNCPPSAEGELREFPRLTLPSSGLRSIAIFVV